MSKAALELRVSLPTIEQWTYKKAMKPEIRYHICWSNSSLDWKTFPTKTDATELAGRIKKPN